MAPYLIAMWLASTEALPVLVERTKLLTALKDSIPILGSLLKFYDLNPSVVSATGVDELQI